jgi:hypothetical protein
MVSQVDVYRRFGCVYFLHLQGRNNVKDFGSNYCTTFQTRKISVVAFWALIRFSPAGCYKRFRRTYLLGIQDISEAWDKELFRNVGIHRPDGTMLTHKIPQHCASHVFYHAAYLFLRWAVPAELSAGTRIWQFSGPCMTSSNWLQNKWWHGVRQSRLGTSATNESCVPAADDRRRVSE